MKDLIWLIVFIIVTFFAIYKTNEVAHLKSQMALIQAHSDTIFTEGKKDTIYKTKTSYIAIKTPKIKIDTTLDYDSHLVKLKVDSLISLEIECKKPDIIITQRDTIKLLIPKIVEVEKPAIWYDKFWVGYTTGIITTTIIAYLFTK